MMKTTKSRATLRTYEQPSLRFFHVGVHTPVCQSIGATTEDYVEDDVFGGGNN